MNLSEAVRTGYLEISCHKMRSFLSFIAIAFGVAAILYTFASVHDMFQKQRQATDLAGPGRLEVHENRRQNRREKRGLSKGLTLSDAQAIREAMPELYMVAPNLDVYRETTLDGTVTTLHVKGVVPDWAKRDWAYTLRGRILNEEDLRTAARVCVLVQPGGWSDEKNKPFWARWVHENELESYLKRHDPLGQAIPVHDQLFTVVGILKNPPRDKDPRWYARTWAQAFVPLSSAQRYLGQGSDSSKVSDTIEEIQIDTGSEESVPSVKRRLESLLDSLHRGEKDYEVEDFREMIQGELTQMRKQAVAILSIGVIAILAGGIGIMNVTLATIFSRIREIGIRRAIGATRGDILVQFVTEAVMLGLMGGVAGIALGLVGLRYLGEEGAEKIHSLQWWHLLATLSISAAAGLLFSLYPAHQASNLDPVEALRYE